MRTPERLHAFARNERYFAPQKDHLHLSQCSYSMTNNVKSAFVQIHPMFKDTAPCVA
ncbi:hypothetical protein BN2475_1050010 [Paraburkholderia ribeironis]|uniref:Uncharacterized protein n=1 Tax=Paraburkholderia ribeironis TaxID=1247936 RepID=A0A1N7SME7_9BURK|nr:hypothetical protein BN2475_1050010 [Paraburkholderia ribeironis]